MRRGAASVNDGHSYLGSITVNEAGEAHALDPSGTRLGVFPNLKNALARFQRTNPSGRQRTKRVRSDLLDFFGQIRIGGGSPDQDDKWLHRGYWPCTIASKKEKHDEWNR